MRTISETIGARSLPEYLSLCHPSKGAEGFTFFAQTALGLDVQWFHKEWIELFLNNQTTCIMAARQHGKCFSKNTRIYTKSGIKYINDIKLGDLVLSLDNNLKLSYKPVVRTFENGIQDLMVVRLKSGDTIECTPEHKFYTASGWKEVKYLVNDEYVGCARSYALNNHGTSTYNDFDIKLLAYFITEGGRGEPRVTHTYSAVIDELREIAETYDCKLSTYRGIEHYFAKKSGNINNVALALKKWNLMDKYSWEKELPSFVYQLSYNKKKLLLNRMFSCDGWMCLQQRKNDRTVAEIGYSTSSKKLAIQVKELLLSFDIMSRIVTKPTYRRTNYIVSINKHVEIIKFIRCIGVLLKPNNNELCDTIIKLIRTKDLYGFDDGIPIELARSCGYKGWHPYKTVAIEKFKRQVKNQLAVNVANSDIKWEQVKSIESINSDITYDIEIEGNHNYVANGIIVHNSEILAVAFPLWISLFNKNKSILIITNAMHVSTEILRRLKNHIYNNALLMQLKGKVWTKTSIITSTGCKIECKPYSNNVRGGTYDYVLADEGGTYEDKDIFYSAVVPTIAKTHGHICVIGTPLSELDLLSELQVPDKGYVCKSYPAINDAGEILWPSAYTKEKLDEMKVKVGALQYSREFLLKIQDESQQIFPPSVVYRALDNTLTLEAGMSIDRQYYGGWDLASSPKGDWTVGFTVCKTADDMINIAHIVRVRGLDYTGHKEVIGVCYDTFHPVRTLIDSSVFGHMLIQDMVNEKHMFVEDFFFTPERRSNILNNLIRLFEAGRIRIPNAGKSGVEVGMIEALRKELSDMSISTTKMGMRTYKTVGAHEDMVMALALACFAAESMRRSKVGMLVGSFPSGNYYSGELLKLGPNNLQLERNPIIAIK